MNTRRKSIDPSILQNESLATTRRHVFSQHTARNIIYCCILTAMCVCYICVYMDGWMDSEAGLGNGMEKEGEEGIKECNGTM
jgi:hypothetical protein